MAQLLALGRFGFYELDNVIAFDQENWRRDAPEFSVAADDHLATASHTARNQVRSNRSSARRE